MYIQVIDPRQVQSLIEVKNINDDLFFELLIAACISKQIQKSEDKTGWHFTAVKKDSTLADIFNEVAGNIIFEKYLKDQGLLQDNQMFIKIIFNTAEIHKWLQQQFNQNSQKGRTKFNEKTAATYCPLTDNLYEIILQKMLVDEEVVFSNIPNSIWQFTLTEQNREADDDIEVNHTIKSAYKYYSDVEMTDSELSQFMQWFEKKYNQSDFIEYHRKFLFDRIEQMKSHKSNTVTHPIRASVQQKKKPALEFFNFFACKFK